MNNTSENKKNIFYITMLIITLLIVIIGVVYALTILVSSRDEGSSAIYTGTLVIDYARTVIAKIKNDANENWKTSAYLDNNICVSSITEPQLLYQTIKANKVNKSDTE